MLEIAVAFALGVLATLLLTGKLDPRKKVVDTLSASAPEAKPDADEEWPDEDALWHWYVEARRAAVGRGVSFVAGDAEGMHLAFIAAQAIGQQEGVRVRKHPLADVPLLTHEELDKKVWRLFCDESESATTKVTSGTGGVTLGPAS